MEFASILCLLFVLTNIDSLQYSKTPPWMKDLVKHATKDTSVYQVMVLIDTKTQDSRINDILREISRTKPTVSIDLDDTNTIAQDTTEIASFANPRSTTLAIIVHALNNNATFSRLKAATDFLKSLSPGTIRPKLLIITLSSEKNKKFESLLRYMWSNKILDATVLEILQLQNVTKRVTSHFFNPFTNVYARKKYTSKSQLFPNKLRNMHGKTLQVGFHPYPPTASVQYNSSGHPLKASGVDLIILEELSRAINFRIQFVFSKDQVEYACVGTETGLHYKMMRNKIQMIGTRLSQTSVCYNRNKPLFEFTTATDMRTFYALVPILVTERTSLNRWKIFWAVNITILFVALLTVLTRLLRFEKNVWQTTSIISIVLGVSVPTQPQKLKERILFTCMVLAFMNYSSSIYALFTGLVIRTDSEVPLDTLDDLDKSGLTPIIHQRIHELFIEKSDDPFLNLIKKSQISNMTATECGRFLLAHRNITCFVNNAEAEFILRKVQPTCQKPLAKIVQQSIVSAGKSFKMGPGSPYVTRIDQILLRLSQAGLIDERRKLRSEFASGNREECKEKKQVLTLNNDLLVVLLSGFLGSFLVFLGELVVNRCKAKFYVPKRVANKIE